MRTDRMQPLPWRHEIKGRKMSAVVDADGHVVAGSLISLSTRAQDRQNHAFIVKAVDHYVKSKLEEQDRNGKVGGRFWCEVHQRKATHVDQDGRRRCDPKLAGITMPCRVVWKEKGRR